MIKHDMDNQPTVRLSRRCKSLKHTLLIILTVVIVLMFSVSVIQAQNDDPLYDKYIAWIMDDYEYNFYLNKPKGNSTGLSNVIGDIDPFADWEAEFGDDPRYWLLRYRYSRRDSDVRGESPIYDTFHLQHAREMGVIDGAGLFVLLETSDDEIWSQYKPDGPSWKVPTEQRVIDEKLQRSKVDELMGAEHDQLLAELLEAAGDESLPHYYAAMFDSQRGDYAAALAHLIDGNRAPNNTNMIGFPFDLHLAGLSDEKPKLSKIVSGSIFMDETATSNPSFIPQKNMVKIMAADASKRDDRAVLDELHTFGCRVASTKGCKRIDALVGVVLVQIAAKTYLDELESSLSVQQVESLNSLLNMKDQVKAELKDNGYSDTMLHPWGTTPMQKTLWHIKGKLTRGRSSYRSIYESIHNDFSIEQAHLRGPVMDYFNAMESFNYNTLEFE